MTWLKKIGQDIIKVLPYILGIGGLVIPAFGSGQTGVVAQKVLGDLNGIPNLIMSAEALIKGVAGQKTGPAKLAAAAPLVQQLITTYVTENLPGSPKVKDQAGLAAAASQITDGFAKALNAFE